MDPIRNPFSPGAGSPPPELVGRGAVLEQVRILLARVKQGKSEKSLLLTGLRGVGKTVLLNRMCDQAEAAGYHTIFIEAHEDKSLPVLLAPQLRNLLYKLDRMEGAKQQIRRGLAVLKSFISSVKVTFDDMPLGLDIDPEQGTGDTGDLELDLPDLLAVVTQAAAERQTAVALLIDELQYFSEKELSALIMAMHRMQQRQLPLVLIGAGLPILPRLAGDSKSYAERLFSFPQIGALEPADAARAIVGPVETEGAAIEPAAVDAIVTMTQGYPYFIQEWGYQAWNGAESSPITASVIEQASELTLARLDQNFFHVRFERLSNGEKAFLRAMAELGNGPYRIGDIAEQMQITVGSLSPRRAKLIRKGMIYSPNYGELAFTVPLFGEFLKRVMPAS
ncbi:ATP-binding protein [Coraliomargarita algicola]|uniref:ATP-binding protein n=1 Tax=Coraliomargarita algicola TaxID=3092156 RepID=A0ABZ0RHB4_9BACT|nr:ATP-binding protein [Coraliomargarita sp. J2-16]WPJ94786.1 ATP-binding protein [Coraliomargarita sp. J2-16]